MARHRDDAVALYVAPDVLEIETRDPTEFSSVDLLVAVVSHLRANGVVLPPLTRAQLVRGPTNAAAKLLRTLGVKPSS